MMTIRMMTMGNIPKVGGAVEQAAPIFPINLYLPGTLPLNCTVFFCTNANANTNTKYKDRNTKYNQFVSTRDPSTQLHCILLHKYKYKNTENTTAALYNITLVSSSGAHWTVFHCTTRLYLHHPLPCSHLYNIALH